MIRFQIPKIFIPGFERILKLKGDDIEKIISFLKTLPLGIGPRNFIQLFNEKCPEYEGSQLAQTIYSLGSFKFSNIDDNSFENISSSLANSFNDQTNQKYSVEEIAQLEINILKLLSDSDLLSATFKAINLQSENSKVYRDAHIVSDIRLLFHEDLSKPERHGLIIHQLKIEAEDNGEKKEYYFSLNTTDLLKLKQQIARAEEKEKLIKSNYSSLISFIKITE